jgi:hypothetical protein
LLLCGIAKQVYCHQAARCVVAGKKAPWIFRGAFFFDAILPEMNKYAEYTRIYSPQYEHNKKSGNILILFSKKGLTRV